MRFVGKKNKWAETVFGLFSKWWDEGGLAQQNFLQPLFTDNLRLPAKNLPPSKSFLHQKYVQEGLSSAEIGRHIFSSRSTVTKYLKAYGIPLKNINNRQKGKTCFGFRQYGGKSVPVEKEHRVIERIRYLKESGYSYQKIADFLNDENIPTKTKNSIWYSKVVRQTCLRQKNL